MSANLHRSLCTLKKRRPSGTFLATGSNDKIIKILNIDENGIKVVSEMTNHDGTIRAVKFLPGRDGPTVLASGGAGDGRIFLTDVTTETVIKYAQVSFEKQKPFMKNIC